VISAFWRSIAFTALVLNSKFVGAEFVLITEDEARMPRLIVKPERGPLPAPDVYVYGLPNDAPASSPLSFVVKFKARGGASIDMDSVTMTYMVKEPVDLTSRIRRFMVKDEIRITDALVPSGSHQIRIFVQDSNGEGRRTFYSFCIRTCSVPPEPRPSTPER